MTPEQHAKVWRSLADEYDRQSRGVVSDVQWRVLREKHKDALAIATAYEQAAAKERDDG